MRARRLIEQQDFLDPESLLAVTSAFEAAWGAIQPAYTGGDRREAARMRLAVIVIELAREGVATDQLALAALEVMDRPLN